MGEYTPGSDVSIGCGLNLWELDNLDDTEDTYRRKMISAETCASLDTRPVIGPFEVDMIAEVIRVIERMKDDEKRNPKYRARFKTLEICKTHNLNCDLVDFLGRMCIAAAAAAEPLERQDIILEVLNLAQWRTD